jgi:hypothetical protein
MIPPSEQAKHDALVSEAVAAELAGVEPWWLSVLIKRDSIPYQIIQGRRYLSLRDVERAARGEAPDGGR